jgi:uncharacterized cupin superfamily protein
MLSRLRQTTPRKHRWTPRFTRPRAPLGDGSSLRLGAAALTPGASSFPLHLHHPSDELIVVLSGAPTRRDEPGKLGLGATDRVG